MELSSNFDIIRSNYITQNGRGRISFLFKMVIMVMFITLYIPSLAGITAVVSYIL